MTSKSIAYNDLTLWNYIKTYSNIFSIYKGNRLQGGSLLCYVFMSAFMFLRKKVMNFVLLQNIYNINRTRWEISSQVLMHQCDISKISTPPWKRTHSLCLSKFWSLWIGASSETKQKCQPFSRCRSALLYQHHRAAEILMDGCQMVNCTMSHSTCSGVSSKVFHTMEMSWWTSVIINVSSPGPPPCNCDGATCTDRCRGSLAPTPTSVAGTTSSSQDVWAHWSGS